MATETPAPTASSEPPRKTLSKTWIIVIVFGALLLCCVVVVVVCTLWWAIFAPTDSKTTPTVRALLTTTPTRPAAPSTRVEPLQTMPPATVPGIATSTSRPPSPTAVPPTVTRTLAPPTATPRPTATATLTPTQTAAPVLINVTVRKYTYQRWGRPDGMDDPKKGCGGYDDRKPVRMLNATVYVENRSGQSMNSWYMWMGKNTGKLAYVCFYSGLAPIAPGQGREITFAGFMEEGESIAYGIVVDDVVGKSNVVYFP